MANSSADAEIRACANAARQTIGACDSLKLMGLHVCDQSLIFVDNNAALSNFGETNLKSALKHVAIDIHQCRSVVATKEISFIKIDTNFNYSDLMTKILDVQKMTYFRNMLCVNTTPNDY